MRIIIQTKKRQYRYIDFGFKTELFSSMYFITSGMEYKDESDRFDYATQDFRFFKNFKFWFK